MHRRLPPSFGSAAHICSGCKKFFQRLQDFKNHRRQSKSCKGARHSSAHDSDKNRRPFASSSNKGSVRLSFTPPDSPADADEAHMDESRIVDEPVSAETSPVPEQTGSRRARVEEVIDQGESNTTFVDLYPADRKAGMVLRKGSPPSKHDFAHLQSDNKYHPFANQAEWELAQWLKGENISDAAIDRYFKMPSAKDNGTTLKNSRDLNQKIDNLPGYGGWKYTLISVDGSEQTHELFFRNPIDCLRALWADPAFKNHISFAPEKHYEDATKKQRLYTDMKTGDFWWEMQGKLCIGATVIPIIISSDKTELSLFTGDATAYPIYMTIGNIDGDVRRQSSRHAQILIGYLPTTAIEKGDLTELGLRNARARIFHAAVRTILEPLREAAATGVHLKSSDGSVRDCYPLLAVYAADYPEQSLVACTRYGTRCPKCKAGKDDFSTGARCPDRDPAETLETIRGVDVPGRTLSSANDELKPHGLNVVPEPFWADWPHANIHQAIAPDVLHQLYQGMVKHLTLWARKVVGDAEIDARFRRAALAHGLRHFNNGISELQRVSGQEHKAIAKQLIGCLAGVPEKDAVRAARALLDFTYMAQYSCHSDETLTMMDDVLAEFHEYKAVFLNCGATESFDLPKLHSLVHYTASIRLFGTTGGYNTEQTERLHIDFAKDAYNSSSHREEDMLPFMCTWLERREKLFRFASYLAQQDGTTYSALKRQPKEREKPAVAFADAPNDRNRTADHISRDHGADQFAEHVVSFIKAYVSDEYRAEYKSPPPDYEIPAIGSLVFSVWHRVKFNTPDVQTLSAPATVDIAHAAPARSRKGKRVKKLPARFDPVMVEMDKDGVAGEGGMEGIRVAQLRVLFELPEFIHVNVFDRLKIARPGKLAYVEWFSKPGTVDDVTGMYSVRRSFKNGTNNQVRQAGIVEAIDLRRSCHLMAKLSGYRPSIPLHLTVHNLFERWSDFWVNNFVDKPAYRTIY